MCVSVFVLFFKELWICRWWAAPVPEAGPPHGRAGTRGRPTAAERVSVFKAFENKLLQFSGCRVGLAEGSLVAASPRVQATGAPLPDKEVRRDVRRVSWEHFSPPT